MKRIYHQGCPAEFDFEEDPENKENYLRRGNHNSVALHKRIVEETMNKEERHNHVVPLPEWVVHFAPMTHHVPQAILVKEGKKTRLVWDGSIRYRPQDICMNEVTPIENEAKITFGDTKEQFMKRIYNLRILPTRRY